MNFVPHELFQACKEKSGEQAFYYHVESEDAWKGMSWDVYLEYVQKIAGWMKAKGIVKGDKVAIFSANRPEWIICDMAILSLGAISVPLYATASEKDVSYVSDHSEAKLFFVDSDERNKILETCGVSEKVVFDKGELEKILNECQNPLTIPCDLGSDDVATIIYTSGTTGTPKGVVHTHGGIASTMGPVGKLLENKTGNPDRFFSFLPLSHVAERLLVGITPIYLRSEVSFARSVTHLAEDLVQCRPTVLLCVPRLWEKIYEKIQTGLKTAPLVKRVVFALAKWLGKSRIEGDFAYVSNNDGFAAKLSDKLVGNTLRTKLGMDRCRMVVTGSAPTRRDVMEFFASFGLFIVEVYGLTENFCLGVRNNPGAIQFGSCGVLFEGNQIKIAEDREILFKAPWNFKEYYKNPEATSEVLKDGWFATGDLGTYDSDGYLRIVGRKKELLKTSTGKYVAPVPIEDEIKALSVVSEAMVVGDNQKYCIVLLSLLAENKEDSWKEELKAHVDSMNSGLANHEKIRKIGVIKEDFSVENGMLTPTMKLKRAVAAKKYEGFIGDIYSASDTLIEQ